MKNKNNIEMKRILWFSRHEMTKEQKRALWERVPNFSLTNINGTAPNVHVPFEAEVNGGAREVKPLKELVGEFDIIAVVMPVGLLQQIKPYCGDKPLIMALNERVFEGDEKVSFKFVKWEKIDEVKIVKSDF